MKEDVVLMISWDQSLSEFYGTCPDIPEIRCKSNTYVGLLQNLKSYVDYLWENRSDINKDLLRSLRNTISAGVYKYN